MMKRVYEVDHWMGGRAVSRARVTIEGDARLVVVLSRDLKELQMSEYSIEDITDIAQHPVETHELLNRYTTWLVDTGVVAQQVFSGSGLRGDTSEEHMAECVNMFLETVGGADKNA